MAVGSGFGKWSSGPDGMRFGWVRCCCVEVGHSWLIVGCNAADGMELGWERRSVCGIVVVERCAMMGGSQVWVMGLLRWVGGSYSMREHRPHCFCDKSESRGWMRVISVEVLVAGVVVEEKVWVLEEVIAFQNKELAVVMWSHRLLTFSSLGPLYTAPTMGGALSTPH